MVNSFFQRGLYTVEGKSILTINFTHKPNYFHITNMGAGELYFKAIGIPSVENFDMKISPSTSAMTVETHGVDMVHIYNNATTAVTFSILSFAYDFDPLVLALATGGGGGGSASSGGSSGGTSFDGIIRGFTEALPSGANTIGKVDLNTNGQLQSIYNALIASIPAGTNLIGKVDLNSSDQLTTIIAKLEALNKEYGVFSSGNLTSDGITITATTGRKITGITMLSNDGESDMTINIDGSQMILKTGEVLDGFKCYADSVVLRGDTVPYRMAYNEKEV